MTASIGGGDLDGVEEAAWLTDRLKAPGPIHALNDLAERLTNLPRHAELGDPGRHGADQHGERANRPHDQIGGKGNPVHAGHVRTTGGS